MALKWIKTTAGEGLLFFGLSLSLFLLGNCGLPTYAYVNPPDVQSQDLAHEKASFKTSEDSDAIEGYEIYYKFYTHGSATLLSSDRNRLNDSDKAGTSLLNELSYSRIEQLNGSGSVPLIQIEPGSGYTIEADFSPVINNNGEAIIDCTSSTPDHNLPINPGRRILDPDTSNTYRSFTDLDISRDADLSGIQSIFSSSGVVDENYLALGLAVIKLNKDLNNSLQFVYSKPVFLGIIENLPYTD